MFISATGKAACELHDPRPPHPRELQNSGIVLPRVDSRPPAAPLLSASALVFLQTVRLLAASAGFQIQKVLILVCRTMSCRRDMLGFMLRAERFNTIHFVFFRQMKVKISMRK